MSGILEGIRVLDLTQAYSGPFCAMHLADQGAEVIKIEPAQGEQSRFFTPLKNGASAYYAYLNRNKKGMTLDLKNEEAKKVLWKLIETADVIIENFKVGKFEEMGFTYEKMKEVNPKIIYGSISGFGLDGPMAKRPCYDIVAQAISGMMSITGHIDSDCVKVGPSIADSFSGTYLSLGIMMALFNRERTDQGQRLDVAMIDTLFSIMENAVVTYTVEGTVPGRLGNMDPAVAPFDSFEAKDGEFVMGCGTKKMWESMCEMMGRPDMITDPRYATNEDRCANYLPDLKEEVNSWTRTKTIDELEELIVAAGIPFGRINDIGQITESDLIKRRNMLWEVYDPSIGENIKIPGCPIKVHGQEDKPSKAAPDLGEDNEAILGELGYSETEIKALKESGAL